VPVIDSTLVALERRLTHVELVYRPGERDLAKRVFELLGCRPVDRGGVFFTSFVDPEGEDYGTNVLYASEVTPAQWAFEQALAGAAEVADPMADYLAHLRQHPPQSFHFGFAVPTTAELDERVEVIRGAGEQDPELAGGIAVVGVYRPDDPGAYTDTMIQAFVWTDVVAAGLLTLGQHLEMQWRSRPGSGGGGGGVLRPRRCARDRHRCPGRRRDRPLDVSSAES